MAIADIFSTVINVIKFGWPFFILFGLVTAKIKWKSWMIDVVIVEKRGKNLVKSNDRAGRYVDKFTGLTGYKLLKNKDTIPVVEFEWIIHNQDKPTNIFERLVRILRPTAGTLFLYKYGSKQYKPMHIKPNENAPIEYEAVKDTNGKPLMVKKYQQFDPRGHLQALNFEVVDWDNMNFMVQEMRASFERRKKSGEWMKSYLMPIAIIACATLISIIMIKYSMDYSADLRASSGGGNTQEIATTPSIPLIGDVLPGQ